LSSIEPAEFTPELVDIIGGSRRICPHLHIPLQSGDDGVLRRMNRNYSRAFFEELVNRVSRAIPGVSVGADVIGGFPGENERAFENTLRIIETLPLAYLHVFPYSKRKGTPAEGFPGQVPPHVIRDRCRALREVGRKKRVLFYRSFLGKRMNVLVENRRARESGMLKGYSQNYIPLLFAGGDEWMNRLVEVEVSRVTDERVFGRLDEARPAS
jgi:threonylcarbamoyladenosine tRNA methylthiotransferase MtaB